MVLQKLDSRIRTLIDNGVALRQRSMFVIVGDQGRDKVKYRNVVKVYFMAYDYI